MKPELDISKPLFAQVKEAIEDDILSGALKADDQIPSNSQLVAFFGINPVTVQKGVSQLLDEGIIYKKRGMGMFVEKKALELLHKKRQESFAKDYLAPLISRAKSVGMLPQEICQLIMASWNNSD